MLLPSGIGGGLSRALAEGHHVGRLGLQAMSDASADVREALKEFFAAKRSLPKVLTSSSIILVALYALGFIFLKTYLAVFGFQIELSSLSIPNLLLAHRFFVAQHFFVAAGVLQSFLFSRLGFREARRTPISAAIVFLFPGLLLVFAYVVSIWSEPNTPTGFYLSAHYLWAALAIGWLTGAVSYLSFRNLVSERGLSFRRAAKMLGFLVLAASLVASYRVFAYVVAKDRLDHGDFQEIRLLQGEQFSKSCKVAYVDTSDFFLLCGNERLVVARDELKEYIVVPYTGARRI